MIALTTTSLSKAGQYYGLFVPIGAGYSHPSFWKDTYFGINVNVLDIGNYASSSTSSSPESGSRGKLSSSLAPGVSIYRTLYGPITFGVSYVAQTRGLRDATNAVGQTVPADQKNSVAFFIAVDVPLPIFNL